MAFLPARFYSSMGVDLKQLKSILEVKLTMDDRRPPGFQQARPRKFMGPVKTATMATMLVSLVMGAVFLFSFSVGNEYITQLTIFFSFFFFMLSATLISDFTSVLIDVRDNYIILPKPVNDRTIVLARLLHISIHICKIVLPLSLPGWVYMAWNTGVTGVFVMLLLTLLVTMLSIFFINAVYIAILRITTPQRFQSIISYVQILFAIVVYASWQIFPRMIGEFHIENFDLSAKQGIGFYPIYWFGVAWQTLAHPSAPLSAWVMTAGAVLLPLAGMWLVVRYLAPSFNNKLALINSAAGSVAPAKAAQNRQRRNAYSRTLSRMCTAGSVERMSFLFTWKMMARSRDFKMKVYPSIGYMLVYVVIMFLNGHHISVSQIAEQQGAGKAIIISALYIPSLLLTMALTQVMYSDQFKASWIYYVSPLQQPGDVILGSAKAAIVRFYVPIALFIAVVALVLVGPSIIPNLLLGLSNELLIAFILVYIGHKVFPFSVHQTAATRSGSFMRTIGLMMIAGIMAVGHALLYRSLPAVITCLALSIVGIWLVTGSIRKCGWEKIKQTSDA